MPHEWVGLTSPQFTAALNSLVYTTSAIFGVLCYLYAARPGARAFEPWLRGVLWLLVVFFVSLAALRLWPTVGIWTAEPGDPDRYGRLFHDTRGWLVFPTIAVVGSSWGILWILAHVSSLRCVYCAVLTSIAIVIGSAALAVWLTPDH